jgi:hypothetical protein
VPAALFARLTGEPDAGGISYDSLSAALADLRAAARHLTETTFAAGPDTDPGTKPVAPGGPAGTFAPAPWTGPGFVWVKASAWVAGAPHPQPWAAYVPDALFAALTGGRLIGAASERRFYATASDAVAALAVAVRVPRLREIDRLIAEFAAAVTTAVALRSVLTESNPVHVADALARSVTDMNKARAALIEFHANAIAGSIESMIAETPTPIAKQ